MRPALWLRALGLLALAALCFWVSRFLDPESRRMLLGLALLLGILAPVSLLTARRSGPSVVEKRAAERMEKRTRRETGRSVAEQDRVLISKSGMSLKLPRSSSGRKGGF